MKKRILSVILALCMMLTLLPGAALAAEYPDGWPEDLSVGDTVTIGGVAYTYEGDATHEGIDKYDDEEAKTASCYLAGEGYVLYNPTVEEDAVTTAALTLHNATIDIHERISLPYDAVVTITLEEDSMVGGIFYEGMSLTLTGSDTASLTVPGSEEIFLFGNDGAPTFRLDGPKLSAVVRSWNSADEEETCTVYGRATLTDDIWFDSLTIPKGATLINNGNLTLGGDTANHDIQGSLVNNGALFFPKGNMDAFKENISGDGKLVDGVGFGGDTDDVEARFDADSIDKLCYTSGEGYIIWEPELDENENITSATLTLHNVAIDHRDTGAYPALEVRDVPKINLVLEGENSIFTAEEEWDPAIAMEYDGEASGQVNVSGDGTLTARGGRQIGLKLIKMDFVVESGKINALVHNGHVLDITVYGRVTLTDDIEIDYLTIPEGATLINNGTLTLAGDTDDHDIQGSLVNNGAMFFPEGFIAEYGSHISGNGKLWDGFEYGGDIEEEEPWFDEDNIDKLYYTCGEGYITWEPDAIENGIVTSATLTLHNATAKYMAEAPILMVQSVPKVDLVLEGENSIFNEKDVPAIAMGCDGENPGQVNVSGDGTLTAGSGVGIGLYLFNMDFSIKSGNVNAIVICEVDGETPPSTTVYGEVTLKGGFTTPGDFLCAPGAVLQISRGAILNLAQASNAINDGKIINNGILVLPADSTGESIAALNLTGSGIVMAGDGTYTNAGVPMHVADETLDFTKTPEDGNWNEDATLEADGYTWDSENQVLTLSNFAQDSGDPLTLPDDSTIHLTDGTINVISGEVAAQHADSPDTLGDLTIKGKGTLNSDLFADNLTFEEGSCVSSYLDALHINITGTAMVTAGNIDNVGFFSADDEDDDVETSVTVGGDAVLTVEGRITTMHYTQTGGKVTILGDLPWSGSVLGAVTCAWSGGSFSAKGDFAAVLCYSEPDLGPGLSILTPAGGKVLSTQITAPDDSEMTIFSIVPANVTELTFIYGDGMPRTNAAKEVVIGTPAPSGGGSTGGGSGVTTYTITATAGEHGSISPSGKVSVSRNADQSFAVKPDEGYAIADVLVDGVSVGAVSSYTFEKVTKGHTISVSFEKKAAAPSFADVDVDAWYYGAVAYVCEKGLFTGTSATTFSPELPMSRAMLWTVLARMDGQDVSGGANWYEKAQTWAAAQGVTDGANPEADMTREQLAVMLYRYAKAEKTNADLNSFSDADSISPWAADAMSWAVAQGILTGKSGNRLDPQSTASRAEVATMLQRFSVTLNAG